MSKIKSKNIVTSCGEKIILRSPQVGDGAKLIQVMKEVFQTTSFTLTTLEEFNYSPEQEDNIIKDYLNHPKKVMIVPYRSIESQDAMGETLEPVGMLNFEVGRRNRNSHLGVFGMSLVSAYRNKGIGKEMLSSLIDWAKEASGVEKIDLEVHSKNTHGIELYKKMGFQVEGLRKKAVKFSEGNYDDILEMSLFVK